MKRLLLLLFLFVLPLFATTPTIIKLEIKGTIGPATSQNPQGIQLRYLQTLSDVSSDKTNTVI